MSAAETPVLALRLWNHGGIGVARTLGRMGVPVHAVQSDARAPVARSHHLREVLEWDLETASNTASLEYVLAAGRRIGGSPVLMACDEPASAFVARNADALREAFLFPRQPAGLTEALYSKRGLHELCLRHEVPTPIASFPQTRDEAREEIEGAAFPIVLKPLDNLRFEQRNGIRMFIARDAVEALRAYDRFEDPAAPNLMLQEYIPGTSASVWVFTGYFDGRSELVFGAGGTKLRQCPIHTGRRALATCGPIRRWRP